MIGMDFVREHEWQEGLAPSLRLNLEQIRQLVALVEREDLAELIVRQGDVAIIVRGRSYTLSLPFTSLAPTAPPMSVETAFPAESAELAVSSVVPIHEERFFRITSPLTGTFYSRPRPDSPPFVTVGSEVAPDQVVALVEAMKFFNEVRSEVRGIVREIVPKDGQLVRHGDTLIVLERLD